eukprot:CCRYP_004198-RC/>CCRYP_004198-RC protein AED:0.47 eAED:0.47 QI:90/1/1/1/0/0/2/189/63
MVRYGILPQCTTRSSPRSEHKFKQVTGKNSTQWLAADAVTDARRQYQFNFSRKEATQKPPYYR